MLRLSRQFLAVLLLMPLAFSAVAQPERYTAGTHYTVLERPVRTSNPDKIEVIEAFWYGCNHCFRFEPLLENWVSQAADDVEFVRFPAIWNQIMQVHAQAFYTAKQLGVLDQVHDPIFEAINVERNRLMNEEQIGDLFVEHGVDREEFEDAFNSFPVRTAVTQAERRMSDYQIRSTPNMIVNGKYLVTTNNALRTQEEMLQVVDFLVEKERQS